MGTPFAEIALVLLAAALPGPGGHSASISTPPRWRGGEPAVDAITTATERRGVEASARFRPSTAQD